MRPLRLFRFLLLGAPLPHSLAFSRFPSPNVCVGAARLDWHYQIAAWIGLIVYKYFLADYSWPMLYIITTVIIVSPRGFQ